MSRLRWEIGSAAAEGNCEACRTEPRTDLCSECLRVVGPACWDEHFAGCQDCAEDWKAQEIAAKHEEPDPVRDYFLADDGEVTGLPEERDDSD